MKFTITTYLEEGFDYLTVISFVLAYPDWSKLEKSPEWENLCKCVDNLQKQRSQKDRQEMDTGVTPRNIGGLTLDIKTKGLHEKIDLINKATALYKEADSLLEQASQISVEVCIGDNHQQPGE